VKIYSHGHYAVVDPVHGMDVKKASGPAMSYVAIGAVTLEPLKLHLSGREGTASERTRDVRATGSTLRFRRDGVPLRAVVVSTKSYDDPRVRQLFSIDLSQATSTMVERPAGSKPTIRVRAYWFGEKFRGRTAKTTIENTRRLPAALASRGAHVDRLETRAYVTMYEMPSAGSGSSAVPGLLPPDGEIQVVSQPLSLPASQAALRALNGENGGRRYAPWRREHITLANGERATVIPNLSEGIQRLPSGEQRVGQFAVITDETLTWVSGGFDTREIAEIARAMRPL
jgi:hypothetical protein